MPIWKYRCTWIKTTINMRKEIWKPIKNYESIYDVSNYGRVRSLKDGKVRILKPHKTTNGYLQVCLYKDGKEKRFLVHRLVWEAFNGTIPEGYEINHINEDKTDNRYPENLNLMTRLENIRYGTGIKRRSEKQSKTVLQLTYPGLEFMCEWSSTIEAGRNGFNKGHVASCCRGERKSHKGVTFRYKETYSV